MTDRTGQMGQIDQPGEPPPAVTSEITWRLAARLYRDHAPPLTGPTNPPPVCPGCGRPWPCSARRLAELGLRAVRP